MSIVDDTIDQTLEQRRALIAGLRELPCALTPGHHEHTGGAVGGPGDTTADCSCGVSFQGFDTYGEAMAALNQHIADEAAVEPVTVGSAS